jgi:hypothetical protein
MISARITILCARMVEAKISTHTMMLSTGCVKTVPTDCLSPRQPRASRGARGCNSRERTGGCLEDESRGELILLTHREGLEGGETGIIDRSTIYGAPEGFYICAIYCFSALGP